MVASVINVEIQRGQLSLGVSRVMTSMKLESINSCSDILSIPEKGSDGILTSRISGPLSVMMASLIWQLPYK